MMGFSWADYWFLGMLFLNIVLIFHVLVYKEYQKLLAPQYPVQLIFILIFIIALFFSQEEIVIYGDKWVYKLDFLSAINGTALPQKDQGFYIYAKLVSFFTDSYEVFFFVTAIIYVVGYYIFIKKHIIPSYRLILFATIISSTGFYAYANNTIRAGLALSLFTMLLSRRYLLNVTTLMMLFMIVFIHKSLLLPAIALIITIFFSRRDHFLIYWLCCFLISLAFGNSFLNIFGEFFFFR